MKIKIQLLTICLLLATQFTNLYSANVYILQEDGCMDRLVYSETNNGVVSTQVVYRIKSNPVSYIFLNVNEENQRTQEFLPPQVVTCAAGTFDEKFVTAINTKQDRAYMVIPMENRKYAIAEVTQAAFYQDMGQLTTYVSPDFSFSFNRNRGVVGEDISVGNSSTPIYFEGTLQNDCSGFFLFRKIAPQAEKPHIDFVLIPEVGISEVRQGLNATDAFNSVSRLEKVNNYLTPEYLRLLCDKNQIQSQEKDLTIKGTEQPKEFDQPDKPKETVAKTSPCGEAGNGFHFVNKGETLYRISKTYDITVSQLKSWNGITSNTIYPCDKLRVVANLNAVDTRPNQPLVDNTPSVTTPPPYDQYVGVKSVSNVTPGWQTNTIYHIVRPGETVAYIAMKYGYTEDRFRAMNNLGADEVARPGQALLANPCPPNTSTSMNTNSNTTRPTDFGNTGMQNAIPGRPDLTTKSPFENNYDFSNDERITPQFYMNSTVPANTAATNDFQTRGGGSQSILSTELQQRSGANPNAYSDTTVPQNYEAGTYKRATHVLKSNETLYDVARMYGITVERLRTLNNLKASDVVIPYQRLYIN